MKKKKISIYYKNAWKILCGFNLFFLQKLLGDDAKKQQQQLSGAVTQATIEEKIRIELENRQKLQQQQTVAASASSPLHISAPGSVGSIGGGLSSMPSSSVASTTTTSNCSHPIVPGVNRKRKSRESSLGQGNLLHQLLEKSDDEDDLIDNITSAPAVSHRVSDTGV